MLYNDLPLYNLCLDDETDGVYTISLVDAPAIERNFICFSEQERMIFTKVNEDAHVLYGPVMIPEMPIYRRDPDGFEYYIKFTKETIAAYAQKFFKDGAQGSVNIDHSLPVDNCYTFSSYLIDRERGIDPVEFKDLPDGTWIVSMKIEDNDLWETIKTTDLMKGFSVEVLSHPHKLSKVSEVDEKPAQVLPDNWYDKLYDAIFN